MQPGNKKATLLEEFEVDPNYKNSRRERNPWIVLCFLFLVISSVFAAAFVGGFFLGKNQAGSSDRKDTEEKQQVQQLQFSDISPKAFLVDYGGSQRVIPAYYGNEPVENFIQCRSVFVEGKLLCSPGNPLLTPKGSVQMFIYQYGENVSLILTGTGKNYGEYVTNASMTGEGPVAVNADGFNGLLIPFSDSYNTFFHTVPVPGQLAMNMDWGNVRSTGFALSLFNASTVDGTISFQSISGNNVPFSLRGAFMHDTDIPELPASGSPLKIKSYQGEIPGETEPELMTEIPFFSDKESSASGFQMLAMQPSIRRRRSMHTHLLEKALGFLSTDPVTGKLNHRVEFHSESRYGGKNGTECWHVKNYVAQIEAHACLLFHDALYDGLENDSQPHDVSSHHHIITNFHYRNMGDKIWNQTSFLDMDVLTDDGLHGLRGKRSFFSSVGHFFSNVGHKIADVGHKIVDGVKTAFNAVKSGVETAAKKVWSGLKTVGHAVANEAKKIVDKCHVLGFIEKGAECIGSGISCGSDIFGEVPSDGLDTLETVSTCAKTVGKCVGFGECF